MDAVRSAYRTKMRFSPGTPLVEVRWYLSPAGAPFMTQPSCFVSDNWATEGTKDWDTGLAGEVPGEARPWSNGNIVGSARMGYKGPAGPAEYWLAGAPSPVWLPLELTNEAIPVACGGPPPPFACYGPGLPGELYARVVRLSGDCELAAGDFTLMQTSPTAWSADFPAGAGTGTWELECRTTEWSVNFYYNSVLQTQLQWPLVTVEPFFLDAAGQVFNIPGSCTSSVFDVKVKTTPFV